MSSIQCYLAKENAMISQVHYELKKVILSYEFWIAFLLSAILVNASVRILYQVKKY